MGQDKKLTNKLLTKLWTSHDVEILQTAGSKYIIMSDLHLGDGKGADDFRKNRETLMRALDYYSQSGFKLILLGDIEELWQFDMNQIVAKYGDHIYARMRAFGKKNVYRVFGNHDLDWHLRDPIKDVSSESSWAVEALKMNDKAGRNSILLVHGHQGSIESDKNSWISRIFVRRIWKPLEPLAIKLGLYGHPSATKSQVATNYELILYEWAKKTRVILICGHSHRAIYAGKTYIDKLKDKIHELQLDMVASSDKVRHIKKNNKEIQKLNEKVAEERLKAREIASIERDGNPRPCYFNCGCGLYRDGITALEIENDQIRLVKWHKKPKKGQLFNVYDDGDGKTLSDFVEQVTF